MNMTLGNLEAYSSAAIGNATLLLEEASLLFANEHYARAYFLAVAAIEETGKAVIAHNARGRNLRDPAVVSKVRNLLNDHPAKIRSAFIGFLVANPRGNAEPSAKLMVELQRGREPSMYTDQAEDGSIHVPTKVVSTRASRDCVRLASACLTSARHHLETTVPAKTSRTEDQLFTLKSTQLTELMNTEDFWWYYIACMEAGDADYATAVVKYRNEYLRLGKAFKAEAL
jgi:AbiV family abortive infection protein